MNSKIINKFDSVHVFTFGVNSGYLDSGIAIIMDIFLACHVCKVCENKFSVLILGLYAGASLVVQFFQTVDINSLIAKTVNESSFVILDGDFNKNDFCKCASFRKCFDLGLINSLARSLFAKLPI
ncbi:hypothetical protein G9A89_005243 [Geosiphon pyriformis]|nr:hypothetical protein G9A89_005243 [Geosiphon pyriformis]